MTPKNNISISKNTLAINNFITLSITHHNSIQFTEKYKLSEVFKAGITYGMYPQTQSCRTSTAHLSILSLNSVINGGTGRP